VGGCQRCVASVRVAPLDVREGDRAGLDAAVGPQGDVAGARSVGRVLALSPLVWGAGSEDEEAFRVPVRPNDPPCSFGEAKGGCHAGGGAVLVVGE